MRELWMYGAGGHARVIFDIIKTAGYFSVAGFIDDNETRSGEHFLGYELITSRSKYETINSNLKITNLFLSVGDNSVREKVAEKMKGYDFPIIIHPGSTISEGAKIGCGTVIMPGSIIESGAIVGKHCIINNGAIIGHSCHIGDFSHISGNAVVSGEVIVGKGSLVAIGACITPQVTIGEKCVIGAGSVISRNVPDGALMMGNPARNMVNFKHVE